MTSSPFKKAKGSFGLKERRLLIKKDGDHWVVLFPDNISLIDFTYLLRWMESSVTGAALDFCDGGGIYFPDRVSGVTLYLYSEDDVSLVKMRWEGAI